jgi:hypothetical protein
MFNLDLTKKMVVDAQRRNADGSTSPARVETTYADFFLQVLEMSSRTFVQAAEVAPLIEKIKTQPVGEYTDDEFGQIYRLSIRFKTSDKIAFAEMFNACNPDTSIEEYEKK